MSAMNKETAGHSPADPKATADNHVDTGSACCHHHAPARENQTGTRLLLTLGLNLLIPVAQIIGGVTANSMALISDATHNFSDFAAIFIAYLAFRIARRGPSIRNTFGYRRAEIMAALINVALLIGAAVVIVIEAAERLRNPAAVSGAIVMGLAAVGILGNGLSAWLWYLPGTSTPLSILFLTTSFNIAIFRHITKWRLIRGIHHSNRPGAFG